MKAEKRGSLDKWRLKREEVGKSGKMEAEKR